MKGMNTEEAIKELEKILRKELINKNDLVAAGKLLDAMFEQGIASKDITSFGHGLRITDKLLDMARKANIYGKIRAETFYSGFLMGYLYYYKNIPRDAFRIRGDEGYKLLGEDIQTGIYQLNKDVGVIYDALDPKTEPALWVKYAILLDLVIRNLQFKFVSERSDERRRLIDIEDHIQKIALELGDPLAIIRNYCKLATEAERGGNREKAIGAYRGAIQKFVGGEGVPVYALEEFGALLADQARIGMYLSEETKDHEKRIKLVTVAIYTLKDAIVVYKKAPHVPAARFEEVKYQLVMAAGRWLMLAEQDKLREYGKEIFDRAVRGNTEKAIENIMKVFSQWELAEINNIVWYIEVVDKELKKIK